ncbi:MAG: translocation/assembly module TamB domain-containing protein [Myxococcales bacterium]
MLSRVLAAIALSAALVSGAAIALLRTEYVGTNLCGYAIATIEEASAAKVKVDRCTVDPTRGQLVIDGLTVGDPGGRLQVRAARVFVHVVVRPLLQRVRLERLEIDHAEVKMALDQSGPARPRSAAAEHQCLPEALDRFELGRVQVRKASLELTSGSEQLIVPRIDAQIHGKGDALKVALRTRGGSVHEGAATVPLRSVRADANVDLRGAGKLDLVAADLATTDATAFVRGTLVDLCRPRVEATARLRLNDLGALSQQLIPGKLAGVSGSLSADMKFTLARGKPRATGDVRLRGGALEGFLPGDLKARFDWTPARLSVGSFELPVGRGGVSGSVELAFGEGLPLSADLQIRDLELQELLRRLTVPHAWVLLKTSGHISVAGKASPFGLHGNASLDIPEFAVLDRAYDSRKAKPQRVFEMAATHLETGIALDPHRIALPGAALDVNGSKVAVGGALNFDGREGLDLTATSDSVRLSDLKGHVGPVPWSGTIALKGSVRGPYGSPTIEGGAFIRDFHLFDLALGNVSGDARFQNLQLLLTNVEGTKGATEYAGRVALDLGKPETPIEAHLEVPRGRVHDIVDALIATVPAFRPIEDAANVDGSISAVVDAKGPAASPDAVASATFSDVNVFGQRFTEGKAKATLDGKEPRLQIEDLTLRRGNGSVTLAGSFGPGFRLEMDAKSQGLTLQDVDAAASAKLSGPVEASLAIRGVADHPIVEAKASFKNAVAGKAAVGDGRASLSLDGQALRWDAQVGPHRLDGHATLEDGSIPYTATLALRFADLTGYFQTFLPDAELRGGAFEADVSVSGDLLRPADSEGTAQVGKLAVERQEMIIENDGPGEVSFGPSGIEVKRLALRAPYTSATLVGSRASSGALALRLVASVDGRLMKGLFSELEHAAGTCLVQATVGGTLRAPTLLGNLRVENGEVRLRGLPFAARDMGGSISFSQDALVIDEMRGKLNGGEVKVSGGMTLSKLVPQKVDLAAHIGEATLRLQDGLNATIEGDVTVYGPPLEPLVGGALTLSRMTYTEDIDVERSLLDFSRRPPAPRVLTRTALVPHFDLDVRLGRGVRIENNLARADLRGEVKLTGTTRNLGLLGSVNTVHGVAQFRGNEFQIEQGVVTFTDRQRIRPSFDLQAVTRIKAAGSTDEFKIHLHGFGTPSEPHLALSSEPALPEADVGFLLTFGFRPYNLEQSNFNATDSGLAIGVEALNKVTGFSEEVRRFIPKNTILRDPNLDFTSDFSVATSRLEPMARFRSHLLTDKIDLRVLQNLSATQRRYRGVLGYQLSDALSGQLQIDNEHLTTTGTDFGADLKFKWEGD